MEEDKISDLPRDIIVRILSRLSIKDTVKTSALSTKWRYKWVSVPSLVFDDKSFPRSDKYNYDNQDQESNIELASQIDRVLSIHSGPMHKFELSYLEKLPSDEIDKWILQLSGHPVEELVLRIIKPGCYNTHSSIFSLQSLTHLELSNCTLPTPSSESEFKGFNNLKSLILGNVAVATQQDLEKLISSSAVLERLTITDIIDVNHLNIHAPNLLCLYINAIFIDVCLISASRLSVLCINAKHKNDYFNSENPDTYGNLVTLIAGVPQIRRLSIGDRLSTYLASGNIPEALQVSCVNLTHLRISVLFTIPKEVLAFRCLLRSAPNLEELHVHCHWEMKRENYGSLEWEWKSPFNALKLVVFVNFMGTKNETDFIKFVLLNSPALKSMNILISTFRYNLCKSEIMKKISCLERVSREAEIRVCEWNSHFKFNEA